MTNQHEPTHDLEVVRTLVAAGRYRLSKPEILNDAAELGFDESDIVACICALRRVDFYKTMSSKKRPGRM